MCAGKAQVKREKLILAVIFVLSKKKYENTLEIATNMLKVRDFREL